MNIYFNLKIIQKLKFIYFYKKSIKSLELKISQVLDFSVLALNLLLNIQQGSLLVGLYLSHKTFILIDFMISSIYKWILVFQKLFHWLCEGQKDLHFEKYLHLFLLWKLGKLVILQQSKYSIKQLYLKFQEVSNILNKLIFQDFFQFCHLFQNLFQLYIQIIQN